jgi:hypothetical protein
VKIKDPDTGDEESIYVADCSNDRHKVKDCGFACEGTCFPCGVVVFTPEDKHERQDLDVCGWRRAQTRVTKDILCKTKRCHHQTSELYNKLPAFLTKVERLAAGDGVRE